MDGRSGQELSGWEILPDHEFVSISPPRSSRNHENSAFIDDSDGTVKPHCSSNPTLNSSQIQDRSVDNTSTEASEWVDPCLVSCLRERVIEAEDSDDETPEKLSDSVDSFDANPEKMCGEAGDTNNEENRNFGVEERDFSVVGETRKERAWWKLPLELIKASVFREKPFWSLSLGVVAMGVILLGRKWYKKRKTLSPPIKVSLEDKQKVSQFIIQAARSNEAFSVVQRVPVIRASLLPAGASPWPGMGLR